MEPYKFFISEMKVPLKIFVNQDQIDKLEPECIKQAIRLSSLPFAFHHTILMPDAHVGKGSPIGMVFASQNYILPNVVGVDIGCGMCFVKSNKFVKDIDKDTIKNIMSDIRKKIPIGTGGKRSNIEIGKKYLPTSKTTLPIVEKEIHNSLVSMGTLGSGNHFIELQENEDGYLCIMIHSGSRNLGLKVATYYNNLALKYSNVESEIPYLHIESDEGKLYFEEMKYCVEYALKNRFVMIDIIKESILNYIDCLFEPMINIAHNYAAMEEHYGSKVLVHRKGATLADKETIGIIPGSQGTSSYIVHGKGNQESFMSSSHGAGRILSRTAAKKNLNLKEQKDILDKQNIIHSIRTEKDLDEAPGAYKDIDWVISQQEDLIEVMHKLKPIAVIKG